MTTNWKSTIHHAYTIPNSLRPTLQNSIPNLIRDEISKLANLTLFQTKVRGNSSHSQVPVDMKFTDDSLNIRFSKDTPWISLVPSTEPMSSEERAVDAIRRSVMEKIALLWGGGSDSVSEESDSGHRNSSRSSTEANASKSRRTRSRRNQRAEHNRQLNRTIGDSVTISGNTIDSSTHTTTNNYYGCTGSHTHSPHTDVREEVVSRRDMDTQTDPANTPPGTPLPVCQSGIKESHSSDDSRESSDSSSDESKQSFTSLSDKSRTEKKPSSDKSDTESESSYYPESSDESEYDSKSSFSIESEISDEPEFSEPDSAEVVNSTLERVIPKEETLIALDDLDISESKDEMSSQDIPDLMTFPDDEEPEQIANSTIDYSENFVSQAKRIISDDATAPSNRDQSTNTEDSVKRDSSSNTVPKNLKSTSTETDPDVFPEKTRDNVDQKIQTEQDLFKEESIHNSTQFINSFEEITPSEDTSKLNQFVNNSLIETDAFIELGNNFENGLDSRIISSIRTNREILQELQDVIDSDPQLITGSDKIDTLLHQLDLEALRLIHNTPSLEIPYLNQEESSSDESTAVNSIETLFEKEDSEDDYFDDEIKDQPIPTYMQSSESFSPEDSDQELETLLNEIPSWSNNPAYIDSTSEKETQNISTQTDIYTTENETQLQNQLRKLQEAFERTKSTHKTELASLLRAQDRLTSTANEKIKQILQNSIQNEKKSFSRYQCLYEKYNKLLEDSTVEIEDLKKALQDLEALDLAKKAESDRLRNQFYSPAPIIISEKEKVETKTQSTQVEDIAKPTASIAVESKPVKIKTNPPVVSKHKKDSLHDRNLEAASLMTLRKEKAALEFAIQRNQFSKTDLATKQGLLKRIDEELVRRNQRPQESSTSTRAKESKTKNPLTRDGRELKDLGKEPFNTLKTKLNDKRTNNK